MRLFANKMRHNYEKVLKQFFGKKKRCRAEMKTELRFLDLLNPAVISSA